ncbi:MULTISPECIES: hypothetical protein [unclassified Streptomyces]|uniref:hypothetical protein n=1 Tax=unclassified Streptomyces TaxID=2593676 RepID=UPI0010103FDC|nr:hypothetical protein [Streptomyces sp. GZWMJZ-114]
MTIDPQEPRAEEPPADPEEPETFEGEEEHPSLERKDHEAVDEADRAEQELVVEEDEEEYR